jgi:hypothetical protein
MGRLIDGLRATSGVGLLASPAFWLVILLWTLGVATASWCYSEHIATQEAQLDEAKRTATALDAKGKVDTAVLDRERQLRRSDRESFDKWRKEHSDADAKTERLVADLRADNRRLRIPVRAVCPSAPNGGGPIAGGFGQEGYADLTAGAAEFLVRIAGRGDDAIRKHAEVVDAYERLRQKCTAPAGPDAP